jgi:hypothetical protein
MPIAALRVAKFLAARPHDVAHEEGLITAM